MRSDYPTDSGELLELVGSIVGNSAAEEHRVRLVAHIRDLVDLQPDDGGLWYALGYALYSFWKPLPDDVAVECVDAFSRALERSSYPDWPRLMLGYVFLEKDDFLACAGVTRAIDRRFFIQQGLEWRAATADEMEFYSLVRIGSDPKRIASLYQALVALARGWSREDVFVNPRLGRFLEGVDIALRRELLPDSVDGMPVREETEAIARTNGWLHAPVDDEIRTDVEREGVGVRLTHVPTGISVSVSTEPTQVANRERALEELKRALANARREAP